MPKGAGKTVPTRKFWKQICLAQAVAIGLSPLLPLTAMAQPVVTPTPSPSPTPGTSSTTPSFTVPDTRSNIIIPTDVLPLSTAQDRVPFGENLQLRLNQLLPSRFYFSGSVETSLRLETNPFQFPTKRALLRQLPPPQQFQQLPPLQQEQLRRIIGQASSEDLVFRVLPNITGGWTVTPRTRLFANYFMIRDQLNKNVVLNTVIHSYAWGIQQDFPIGQRGNLQAEMQFRELNQTHQQSVFDFLPGLTFSYIVNPKTVAFANALVQMRGKKYFQAPTKEIDPFYTGGILHSRGGWTFAASTTLVQNFREPFRGNATLPFNNYAIISDFEISRRIFKQIPGFQGFVRAEPIWNFHSHNRPGLAGMDFRLFFGFRGAVAKPALTATINNIIEQLRQQETDPPSNNQAAPKPSAYYPPQIMADVHQHQPIHGEMGNAAVELASAEVPGTTPVMPEVAPVSPVLAENPTPSLPAGPPDITKADWTATIANLPTSEILDTKSIEQRWNELDLSAANSTGTAYDTTEKRIATYLAKPQIEVAKAPTKPAQPDISKIDISRADWSTVVSSVPDALNLKDTTSLLSTIEKSAAESSAFAYESTVKRLSPLFAKAQVKPVIAAAPVKPVIAESQAKPVIAAAPTIQTFSADPKRVTELLSDLTAAAQSLDVPKLVDSNYLLGLSEAGASQSTIAAASNTETRIAHYVARKAPEPKAEVIDIAKADWSGLTGLAKNVETELRLESINDVIATAESASTTYGAQLTTERIASIVHVAPIPAPSQPMPVAIKPITQPAPKPMTPVVVAEAKPNTTPTPKQITVASSQPEPQAVALAPTAPIVELAPTAKAKIADLPTLKPMTKPEIASQPSLPVIEKTTAKHKHPEPLVATLPVSNQPEVKLIQAQNSTKAPEPRAIPQHEISVEQPKPIAVSVPPVTMPAQPVPVTAVDLANAPNWDSLAQLSVGRTVLSWQYLGGLRAIIDTAANDSARSLDYTVLQKMRKTAIAARPPQQVSPELQKPAPMSSATIFVPMKKITPPEPLGVERRTVQAAPLTVESAASSGSLAVEKHAATGSLAVEKMPASGSLAVERAEAKEGPPTAPRGWNHASSMQKSKMQIHIVPPLPTVHVNDKSNPFKDAGIDIKKMMLSVPR